MAQSRLAGNLRSHINPRFRVPHYCTLRSPCLHHKVPPRLLYQRHLQLGSPKCLSYLKEAPLHTNQADTICLLLSCRCITLSVPWHYHSQIWTPLRSACPHRWLYLAIPRVAPPTASAGPQLKFVMRTILLRPILPRSSQ